MKNEIISRPPDCPAHQDNDAHEDKSMSLCPDTFNNFKNRLQILYLY